MDYTAMILGLAGGLGLFLYGMKLMSDGLEKVAGSKMKSILEMCTKNRVVGLVVGLLFTAVIQSSSATTSMVVGFVNAGLISLTQAVGPILGANIGTTITGQLVSFDLGELAPAFIFIGVVMIMFFKNQTIKRLGEVVLGFGILFFGMETMSGAMYDVREAEVVKNIISTLRNPFLALMAGFLLTAVIQSSSATVGIIIAMAGAGVITDIEMVFFMVLGCNIGSCVTALLVSLAGKKDAKRSALIHLYVNIFGSALLMLVLVPFSAQIEEIIINITKGMMVGNYTNEQLLSRSIANAHTIFKIIQVILMFPLAKPIVKLTQLTIRGEDKVGEGYQLVYITQDQIITPSSALIEAVNEIKRMGELAANNLQTAFEAVTELDKMKIQKVYEVEKEVDFLCTEITHYLVKLNQHSFPIKEQKNIAGYFHVVNDLERISDHAENLADFATSRIEEDIVFSNTGISELTDMFEKVMKTVNYSIETFTEQTEEHLKEIVALEKEVDVLEKELQHNHVRRLATNECKAKSSIFSDMVSNLERVSDHATNIAFAIYDEDQYNIN